MSVFPKRVTYIQRECRVKGEMCKKCDVCVKAIEIKIGINCERIQGSNDGL